MIGDVIELPLPNGQLGYAQFVFYYRAPPVWGHLIRVLRGTFKSRPESFREMVQRKEKVSGPFSRTWRIPLKRVLTPFLPRIAGRPTMNPYPSYIECSGLYNVNPSDEHLRGIRPDVARSRFHRTANVLPTLTWHEVQSVWDATYQTLVKHGRPQGMGEPEATKLYRFAASHEMKDRTVRVELANLGALTPELARVIQAEVLAAHPLWRVFIVGESPETVIIIYPQVVRAGPGPVVPAWEQALLSTVAELKKQRDLRTGPQRRQVDWLKLNIPGRLRRWTGLPYEVAGIFDNYGGDRTELSVWLLYSGPNSKLHDQDPIRV
jgi:hypothetical protein